MNVRWLLTPCCSTHNHLWLAEHRGSVTSLWSSYEGGVSSCLRTLSSLESSFRELEELFDAGGPPGRGSKLCRQAMIATSRWVVSDLDLPSVDLEPLNNCDTLVNFNSSSTLEVCCSVSLSRERQTYLHFPIMRAPKTTFKWPWPR